MRKEPTNWSAVLRAIPALPGKAALARRLLRDRLSACNVDITTRHGLTLRVPSLAEPIAFHLYINGVYEPELLQFLQTHLPDDGVFVDVGANIGSFAITLAKLRPRARIIAIEPSPAVLPYLRHNIAHNGTSNVELLDVAAYSSTATLDFYVPPASHFGMGSIGAQFDVAPVRVAARALDDILRERAVAHVDVMKIDAEGAEADVLAGAGELLSKPNAPIIAMEFVDWAERRIPGRAVGEAQQQLLDAGYTLETLPERRRRKIALATPLTEGSATIIARKQKQPG